MDTGARVSTTGRTTHRLVLLFDGTGQRLRTGSATNVVQRLKALDREVEAEIVLLYDTVKTMGFWDANPPPTGNGDDPT